MCSDREEWPEPFTKEDADRAEVREFELQQRQSAAARGPAPGPDCQQYWPSDKWVCGAIRDKYNVLGAQFSFLLWPTSDELVNPDGFGRRQTFQNGPIYWSAASGAHPVANHFFAAWQRNGWEAGPLKYPTTDEIVNSDGLGRRQEFQGGTVYWKLNEAYFVGGAIRDKWNGLGAEGDDGLLGYPTSDETILPDGQGRMNHFERGVVYWNPTTGAHEIGGLIQGLWSLSGYETGQYGYPSSGEHLNTAGDVVQNFQTGQINLTQTLDNAGSAELVGKQVNQILLDALERYAADNGFDLEEVLNGSGSGMAQRSSNDGGISVPANYIYDPDLGSLHDYCTSSPDQFPSPGTNADFSGGCARHDMCYEANEGNSAAYVECNRQFKDDLLTVCDNVYSGGWSVVTRNACKTTARSYYEVVVLRHPSEWGGHLDN
ncbi:phospholipase A2 [Rhodococcus qingshengii]|uniref:phospholipase A2 n=1 Tax=Rhodococcus TaxID=1827 RepID=UPI001BAFD4DC|nr:phospholipase A2 [Rhodococcus qingshengii]MBS3695692.1 LGFP repeat-containing protein [Rhodococcus qingshengii]